MTTLVKRALVCLLACQVVYAADDLFRSASFDAARELAKKEGKLVFVDFYTTWCGPCKVMESTTFADEKVIAWLNKYTVAVKIDAEKETEVAKKYAIETYPTLLFAKPDGTELGRMVGLHEAEAFLEEAAAIKAGKTPLERAKEKLVAAGENDPSARMHYAETLAQIGMSEEALKEYLWCFDEGNKQSVGFGGVRLSFLLSDIMDLGQKYPPALEALRKRRDALREQLETEEPKTPSLWSMLAIRNHDFPAQDYAALNQYLGEDEATLAFYDKMRKEHPDWQTVEQLRMFVFDQLREAHRYKEIADSTDIVRQVDDRIALDARSATLMPQERDEELAKLHRQMLLQEIAEYYEVLVGVGDQEGAAKLAERALKIDDGAETYNLLAWHGYLTGRPTEVNLEQARKANELTEGHNAAIVDTLARVLAALDKKSEACDLLRKTKDQEIGERERAILATCTAELDCGAGS